MDTTLPQDGLLRDAEPVDLQETPASRRQAHNEHHDFVRLDGGSGRAVFFRPQRLTADDLRPLALTIRLGDGGVQAELLDISQSGIGVEVPADTGGMHDGATIAGVELYVDGEHFYAGDVFVAVSRPSDAGRRLGLSLTNSMIDIDALTTVRDIGRWDQAHAAPLSSIGSPWAAVGPHASFKAELLDLRLYLDETRDRLDELERTLPWSVLHGEEATPARAALISLATRDLLPEFDRRVGNLFELVRHLPIEESKALVPLSQRMVQAHFLAAPWLDRAWQKPLGYAGDYRVMNHMYRCELEGPTLFAKAMSWASLHAPSPQAVRTRKQLIKDMLRDLFASKIAASKLWGADAGSADKVIPVRILSVASGPAEATYELLDEATELPPAVEIILFDQDPGALAFAHGRLTQLVDRKWPGRVRIIFLHDTIRRLAQQETVLADLGPMDAVFSTGLFDYLDDRFAAKLTGRLYQLVRPGGWVAIGNMDYANPNRWVMEHLLDWWLIFRSQDEMRAFAQAGAPNAEISMRFESTGINPFVVLTRPEG